MRRLALPTAALVLALVPSPALATGEVLFFTGWEWSANTDPLIAALESAGATSVESGVDWPSDYGEASLAFIVLPHDPTDADIAAAVAFVDDGGALVVVGEYPPYADWHLTGTNALFEAAGLGIRFPDGGAAFGCAGSDVVAKHPIVRGVDSVTNAGIGDIEPGANAVVLVSREAAPLVVVEGGYVVIADSNVVNTVGCYTADVNPAFWSSLYAWSCDQDDDAVMNARCGGSDWDDRDASVQDEPSSDSSGGAPSPTTGNATDDMTSAGSGAGSTTDGSSLETDIDGEVATGDSAPADEGTGCGCTASSASDSAPVSLLTLVLFGGARRARSRSSGRSTTGWRDPSTA